MHANPYTVPLPGCIESTPSGALVMNVTELGLSESPILVTVIYGQVGTHASNGVGGVVVGFGDL